MLIPVGKLHAPVLTGIMNCYLRSDPFSLPVADEGSKEGEGRKGGRGPCVHLFGLARLFLFHRQKRAKVKSWTLDRHSWVVGFLLREIQS